MTRQLFTPREYQTAIIDHVLDVKRCGVWAGMGTGKTVSVLSALDMLFFAGYETKPALVIAPLRVARSTWPDEALKWEHLQDIRVRPITGGSAARMAALMDYDANVFTINYENLPWLIERVGQHWPFGVVVADESTKLKGFRLQQGTRRARALAKVAHSQCTRFIELTGTPSPNGLQDLWGQSWFLDAGERLGRTYSSFRQRWFRQGFDGYSIEPMECAQKEIEGKLRDLCVSINAADYFDVRDPIVNNIYVDLPEEAMASYREMEDQMFAEIEGNPIEAINAAARTMKCLQLANGAAYINGDTKQWVEVHDEKLQALDEIIEEACGAPVLVAYHFRSDLERIKRAFPSCRVLDQRPSTITEWNDGKIPLLLAHPASAGHGLNLQDGGNILVFFGHNWNLEEFQQIIERIGPVRQLQAGHDRPVFIHHIIARDTIEESVMERMASKREVQDLLLEAMKHRREE